MTDEKSNRKIPWVLPIKRPNFYFPRLRISIPTVPTWVLHGILYASLFYIFSGGVYDLLNGNIPTYIQTSPGNVKIVRDDTCNYSHQFLLEGIIAGVLIMMGSLGLYFIDKAKENVHNPDRAAMYQLIGIVLLVISFIILENMLKAKECEPIDFE